MIYGELRYEPVEYLVMRHMVKIQIGANKISGPRQVTEIDTQATTFDLWAEFVAWSNRHDSLHPSRSAARFFSHVFDTTATKTLFVL